MKANAACMMVGCEGHGYAANDSEGVFSAFMKCFAQEGLTAIGAKLHGQCAALGGAAEQAGLFRIKCEVLFGNAIQEGVTPAKGRFVLLSSEILVVAFNTDDLVGQANQKQEHTDHECEDQGFA